MGSHLKAVVSSSRGQAPISPTASAPSSYWKVQLKLRLPYMVAVPACCSLRCPRPSSQQCCMAACGAAHRHRPWRLQRQRPMQERL